MRCRWASSPRRVIDLTNADNTKKSRGVEVLVLDNPECRELMERFIAAHPELWSVKPWMVSVEKEPSY